MRATILLVEDEDDTRDMLGKALARAGYVCVAAKSAEEARAKAATDGPFALVVTDVVLGSEDRGGLRLLTDLRAAGVRAPVIVITAFADVERVKFALNEGAAHFLEKPFRAADLVAAIARVEGGASEASDSTVVAALAHARLTEKEMTVARHLLKGLSSGEIADLEHNSPKTIRQHVSQIYAKCGVGSRAELFRLVFVR